MVWGMYHCTGGSEKNPGIRHRPQRKAQPLETFLRDSWPRILTEWRGSTMWWLKAWATPKGEKGDNSLWGPRFNPWLGKAYKLCTMGNKKSISRDFQKLHHLWRNDLGWACWLVPSPETWNSDTCLPRSVVRIKSLETCWHSVWGIVSVQ